MSSSMNLCQKPGDCTSHLGLSLADLRGQCYDGSSNMVLGLFIVTVLSISTSRILHRKQQHFAIDQVIPHTRSWRMPAEHDGLIHMLSSWNSFLPSTGHVTPRPVWHWDGETLNPMDCSSSWKLLLSWCLSYLTLKLQMMSLTPLLLPWIAWGRDVIGKQELEQLRVNKW